MTVVWLLYITPACGAESTLSYMCCRVLELQCRGEVIFSFLCALLGSAVEEVNAFVFRTTSLCEMYKQRYFIAFDQKNTDL